MTDRIALAIRTDELARGLWRVSLLMAAGRVTITDVFWADSAETEPHVMVDVTGYPDHRDEILSAMGDPEWIDWTGETGTTYRDWTGDLLTMRTLVQEILPPPSADDEPEPPASDPAGDRALGETAVPVPACLGAPFGFEASCGEPGPHGWHELGDVPPFEGPAPIVDEPQPVIELSPATDVEHPADCTECYAHIEGPIVTGPYPPELPMPTAGRPDDPGHTRIIVRPAAPGEIVDGSRWAETGERLVPADRDTWADEPSATAWRRYAMARARLELTTRFSNPYSALSAVDGWQGRHMLTDADAATLAAELVDESEPVGTIRTGWREWGPFRRRPRTLADASKGAGE